MAEGCIRERTARLLETGDMSDVTFLIGRLPNQKSFNPHKLILSMASGKLRELILYPNERVSAGRVEIPDMEPSAFEVIIRFIYTDRFSLENSVQATNVYLVASEFNIDPLAEQCLSYITAELDNVYYAYEKALEHNDRTLKSHCENIIMNRCGEVMENERFLQASSFFVQSVIKLDYLNAKSELFIFEMVFKWAEAQCEKCKIKKTPANLREMMTDFLPCIRFLCMTSREIRDKAAFILTPQEKASICQNIAFPASPVTPLPLWCNRVTRERYYMYHQIYFCCYYGKIPNRKHISSHVIRCSLKVNRKIYFIGVDFYIKSVIAASEQIILSLRSQNIVIGSGQNFKFNLKSSILTVFFSEPIPLNIDFVYTVKVLFFQKVLLCGSKVRKRNDSREYNTLFDVNPQIVAKGVVWEVCPHFRDFLYRICL